MVTATKKRVRKSPVGKQGKLSGDAVPKTSLRPGDIVMFNSVDPPGSVGPGRLCSLFGFQQACVMFGDGIGCRRVGSNLLTLAPPGFTAPQCDECSDC